MRCQSALLNTTLVPGSASQATGSWPRTRTAVSPLRSLNTTVYYPSRSGLRALLAILLGVLVVGEARESGEMVRF